MKNIVILQRFLMHYRIPVYERLVNSSRAVTVYFGDTKASLPDSAKCEYRRLGGIPIRFSFGEKKYAMPFYPQIALMILKTRPDVVVMEGATNLANNIFAYPAAKFSGARVIWWDAGRRAGSRPNVLRRMADPLINAMMRHADACIAYSSLAKEYMVAQGVRSGNITIAFNTIDTEAHDACMESNRERSADLKTELGVNGKKVIMYVGVIEARKRVELLIDAYANLRREGQDSVLLIVGSGPHEEAAKEYAKSIGTTGILFLGRKVEDLGAYLLLADVFVLPSEGGLAVVEAMVHGLPVVVSSADGTERDLVREGENGFIVPEEDTAAITDAVRRILSDDGLRRRLSAGATAITHDRFSIATFVASIDSCISGLT